MQVPPRVGYDKRPTCDCLAGERNRKVGKSFWLILVTLLCPSMACALRRLAERSLNAQQPSTQRGRRRVRFERLMQRMARRKLKIDSWMPWCYMVLQSKNIVKTLATRAYSYERCSFVCHFVEIAGKLGLRFTPCAVLYSSLRVVILSFPVCKQY